MLDSDFHGFVRDILSSVVSSQKFLDIAGVNALDSKTVLNESDMIAAGGLQWYDEYLFLLLICDATNVYLTTRSYNYKTEHCDKKL
jgi:hypothetical protein